jgi:hypothetical protein
MRRLSWPAYKRILQRSSRPILVGPFTSEVGFEALYWVPFVQALGIDPARLIPVTRGGASVWYDTPQRVELFDYRSPKDLRIENALRHAKTKALKQTSVTDFDRQLLKDVAAKLGLTKYHVLHPAWMYQLLMPFWTGEVGLEGLWDYVTVRDVVNGEPVRKMAKLTAPALPDGLTLPKQYACARFYARATFPYSELTVSASKACLEQLAQIQPVILLNPGIHADEHTDLDFTDIPNVFRLTDLCPVIPEQNLALQTAVLAHAVGFVGTYGGLAQVALRLGKPSVSFYTDWHGTAFAHKHLSEALAVQAGVSFLTLRLMDVPLLKAVVPDLVFQAAGSSGQGLQAAPVDQPGHQHAPAPHEDASIVGIP